MPTFHQAVNGPNADDYIEAMKLEVNTLVQQRTWEVIPRTSDMNGLKSTRVFKLKRLPDGTPLKFKARFCARGDLQKKVSTILRRMLLWCSGRLSVCYSRRS